MFNNIDVLSFNNTLIKLWKYFEAPSETPFFHFMVHMSSYSCSNITCISSGCVRNWPIDKLELTIPPTYATEDKRSADHMYIYFVLTLCLTVFNIAANGFSFFVFRSHVFGRSIMSRMLMGLSFYEVLLQFTTLVNTVMQIRRMQVDGLLFGSSDLAFALAYFQGICRTLTSTFQISRNWVIVFVSYYRYEAVCRATSQSTLFKDGRIFHLLLSIGLLAFVVVFPRFFEAYEVICETDSSSIQADSYYNILRLQANPLVENAAYNYFYLSTVVYLLQSGVPVICVGVLSAFVTQALWERQKFRSAHNMRQQNNSSDKLMIALAVTFFVLETPSFFSKVLSQSNLNPVVDALLVSISNLCVYVDSTMNIFIYLLSNPTFRRASFSVTPRGANSQRLTNDATVGDHQLKPNTCLASNLVPNTSKVSAGLKTETANTNSCELSNLLSNKDNVVSSPTDSSAV